MIVLFIRFVLRNNGNRFHEQMTRKKSIIILRFDQLDGKKSQLVTLKEERRKKRCQKNPRLTKTKKYAKRSEMQNFANIYYYKKFDRLSIIGSTYRRFLIERIYIINVHYTIHI